MKKWALVLAAYLGMASAAAAEVDQQAVGRLYDFAFKRTGGDAEKRGLRTDGLVVVKGGEIVLERYHEAGGFTDKTPHITWSVSKSALNALIGIAVESGRIDLDDPVGRYVPELAANADDARPLRIRHVLEMSSCLQWAETYEGSDFTQSSVLAMLYGAAKRDMGHFVTSKPVVCRPGSQWAYASGNSVVLMRVLKAVYGEHYATMPWTELFEPLGMESAVWETDKAGTFIGSSYLYATPRDLAKLGLLFLHDGTWGNRRLLPEGWARYSGSPAAALRRPGVAVKASDGLGGAHWWSNAGLPEKGVGRPWVSAPADTFAALGHWGQAIYVIPSLDLVIVRTADDRDGTFDENEFLRLVLDAVKVAAPGEQPTVLPASTQAVASPGPAAPASVRETAYWSIPGLSSAFVAKELCSCLFVMHRTEAQCAVYASQSPMFATYAIDWDKQTVRAALRFASIHGRGLFANHAVYRSERTGCALQ